MLALAHESNLAMLQYIFPNKLENSDYENTTLLKICEGKPVLSMYKGKIATVKSRV